MNCDGCKWAEWTRTKNGRLHPDKTGKCACPLPSFDLPAAYYFVAWVAGRDAGIQKIETARQVCNSAYETYREQSLLEDIDLLTEQIDAIRALTPPPEIAAPEDKRDAPPLAFTYRNWRGEICERQAIPGRVYFGATEWHPEPQWLMSAFDLDKGAVRDFAIKDMSFASADPRDAEIARLRAQLAKRDALLREAQNWVAAEPAHTYVPAHKYQQALIARIDALLNTEGE